MSQTSHKGVLGTNFLVLSILVLIVIAILTYNLIGTTRGINKASRCSSMNGFCSRRCGSGYMEIDQYCEKPLPKCCIKAEEQVPKAKIKIMWV